jgi:outer membrane receptor protein involved in Fe transport
MKSRFLTQSLLAFSMISSQLFATTQLDPVVIGSDFRDTKLSKAIGGTSVIDSATIEKDNSNNIENIIGKLANVNFTSGASRAHFIQIRGIGERSQFTNFINPSVGIVLDGIDLSQSALAITPFDLAQIEVLRGPQGTTFGANGLAGVINISSNPPTKNGEFHTEATFGNYGKEAFGIATGGELVEDRLLGRLSVYTNQSDGFIRNSFLQRDDTSNIDELTIKGHLKWLVDEGHTIDLNYLHLDVDNGYDDFTLDNSRVSHSDEPGEDKQKSDGFSLKSTYQLNPKMHLITAISGSSSDLDYGYDEDWSYVGEFADDLGPYSSKDEYIRDRKLYDFDMRVVSDKGGEIFGGRSAWSVGVYYKNFDEDLKRVYTYLETPFKSSYEATNMAIYGQLDTRLSEKLLLTTGLRVESWDADYSDSDKLSIDSDEVLNGGKIGLKYQQDDNHLYYLALSKGYKPGGVNPNNSLPQNARDYDTEALYNLDLVLWTKRRSASKKLTCKEKR